MRKLFVSILLALLGSVAWSQTPAKHDVLLKVNGDEMTGKVTEINDSSIKFTHEGESLVYTIKKMDILKITFASGRIEFFNKQPLPSTQNNKTASGQASEKKADQTSLQEHHNKVAILPFKYIVDKNDAGEEMTYKVQTEAFAILQKNNASLELQDPNTTNALLIKAGVTNDNIRGFTMGEICNILGVEYLVQGTITQNTNAVVSSQYSSSSSKSNSQRDGHKSSVIGTILKSSSQNNSSSTSTSTKNYRTSITMNVYTDKGHSIFSQSHDSMWNTNEAYKITLQYLLKRTPIYRK